MVDSDIRNMEKNNNPIEKIILEILFSFGFLKRLKVREISIIKGASFSIFNPTMNEVIVVAILLPKTIPKLWLNVSKLALIRAIVIMISAELDWIMAVEIKPVNKLE